MRIFRLLDGAGNDIQGKDNHLDWSNFRKKKQDGWKKDWKDKNDRIVAHLGIETCYNSARKRGNERVTSRKQLGDDSRCLGINSEKSYGNTTAKWTEKKSPIAVWMEKWQEWLHIVRDLIGLIEEPFSLIDGTNYISRNDEVAIRQL